MARYNQIYSLPSVIKADRLVARMSELGLSQSELGRRVGVSQATIAKLAQGKSYGSSHLHAIARELHTTPGFLLGESSDPSETASALPSPTALADQLDAVLLPEVEVSYSMGGGSVIEDWPVVRQVPFSRTWLRNLTSSPASELVVARGEGDSMIPTILDQDLVIIDLSQKTPRQNDRIWAMSYGGLGMIKRFRQLPDGTAQINSDNTAVTPIHAVDGEVFIVGRVCGVIRKI